MLWNLSLIQKNLAQICVSGIQSDSICPWFRRITTTRTLRTARSCWVQQNPIGMCFFQLPAASLQKKWRFLLHVSAIQRHGETYVKLENIPKNIESTKMFNFLKVLWIKQSTFGNCPVWADSNLFRKAEERSHGNRRPDSIAFSTDCLEALRRGKYSDVWQGLFHSTGSGKLGLGKVCQAWRFSNTLGCFRSP